MAARTDVAVMNEHCQSCRMDDGVVYVEFGKRLLCGFCFAEWTLTLAKKVPYMDTERKLRRVEAA